jgi:hypothetical protein
MHTVKPIVPQTPKLGPLKNPPHALPPLDLKLELKDDLVENKPTVSFKTACPGTFTFMMEEVDEYSSNDLQNEDNPSQECELEIASALVSLYTQQLSQQSTILETLIAMNKSLDETKPSAHRNSAISPPLNPTPPNTPCQNRFG